jgi:hypothetical protein
MSEYKENEGPYDSLNSENTALLLIDHQVGLMQLTFFFNSHNYIF